MKKLLALLAVVIPGTGAISKLKSQTTRSEIDGETLGNSSTTLFRRHTIGQRFT